MLKTSVIVILDFILINLKEKSEMDDVYICNDIDKLYMICKDLEKCMKHLKKYIGIIKQNLQTISPNQTDSYQTLMKFLK